MAKKPEAHEDLEVLIPEDDAPPVEANGAEVVKVEAEPAREAPKVVEPEEGLETLKAQLDAERAGRAADQQALNEANRRAADAQGNVQDTNLQLVTNAIGTVTQQIDMLEGQYAEALATQDYASAAKIQREMSGNAVKLQRLEEGKLALERQPKPQPKQIVDPVEAFASNLVREGNHNSAAWIRRHPEFITDPRQLQRMTAAANLALADGLQNDSPAFIESVERTLNLRQSPTVEVPDGDALSEAASASAGRRISPPAAPVSRGSNGTGSAPRTVRLTAAQREAAEDSGLSYEEYAKQLVRIENERVH